VPVTTIKKPRILAAASVSQLRAKAKEHEKAINNSATKSSSSLEYLKSSNINQSMSGAAANSIDPTLTQTPDVCVRLRRFMPQTAPPPPPHFTMAPQRPIVLVVANNKPMLKQIPPVNPSFTFSPISLAKHRQQNRLLKSHSTSSLISAMNYYESLHLYENQPIREGVPSSAFKTVGAKSAVWAEQRCNKTKSGERHRSKSIDTMLDHELKSTAEVVTTSKKQFILFVNYKKFSMMRVIFVSRLMFLNDSKYGFPLSLLFCSACLIKICLIQTHIKIMI
jgi:hypothetical protein